MNRWRIQSNKVIGLGFFLVASMAFAQPGDVVQIDHDNLVSFTSVKGECYFASKNYGSEDAYWISDVDLTIWVVLKYREGSETRTLAYPMNQTLRLYQPARKEVMCRNAEDFINKDRTKWNRALNDIKKNNILPAASGGCLVSYLVTTATREIEFAGGKADEVDLGLGEKIVSCPK